MWAYVGILIYLSEQKYDLTHILQQLNLSKCFFNCLEKKWALFWKFWAYSFRWSHETEQNV